jgi:hypothetical protein
LRDGLKSGTSGWYCLQSTRCGKSLDPRSNVLSAPRSNVLSAPRSNVSSAPRSNVSSAPRSNVSSAPRSNVSSDPRSNVRVPHVACNAPNRQSVGMCVFAIGVIIQCLTAGCSQTIMTPDSRHATKFLLVVISEAQDLQRRKDQDGTADRRGVCEPRGRLRAGPNHGRQGNREPNHKDSTLDAHNLDPEGNPRRTQPRP